MIEGIKGSCHCGMVNFELTDKPKLSVNCHCDDCKKRNGSAFSTYMAVLEKDLNITNGAEYIQKYEKPKVGIKYFCKNCGSPIYNQNFRFPGLYMMFYGAFLNPQEFSPSYNVFCSSKHGWVNQLSSLPSFEESIEK